MSTTASTASSSASPTSCGAPRTSANRTPRLLGDVRDRCVLEIGCGSAMCSRWLVGPGRPRGRDRPVRRHAAPRAAGNAATGIEVPLVQADAQRLPFRDDSFDLAFTAFGAIAVRRRLRRGDARGGPRRPSRSGGGCSRRPIRCAGRSPTTRAPTACGRPCRTGTALPTSSSPPTAVRSTSSTTAPSATGCANSPPPGSASSTSSNRNGRPGHTEEWGQWSPLRGAILPGTAIYVCELS